ncbi:MAG: hypothetical protein O3C58_10740, partial [Nitrospinae bacterium]|nr:hypothetical protein [Nitrospinota bacterium]
IHLCKALLCKEGLGEVIKKLPLNTPPLGAGIIYLSTENLTFPKNERIGSYGELENTDDALIIRMNSIAVFTVGALFIVIASNFKG